MSTYCVMFIPECIETEISDQEISKFRDISFNGEEPRILNNDKIAFADAGENFEQVMCPFCKVDLMSWWGTAMSLAYSEEEGFTNLKVVTPCCGKTASLHNLAYVFPQGFYRIKIEFELLSVDEQIVDAVATQLESITKNKWRIILARY